MNNEQFIKPIQKKPASTLPAVAGSQAPGAADYDPVRRLTDELSRMNDVYRQVAAELAALKQRQDRAEQKPQAATLADVQELAGKRPPINLNAQQFADHVKPSLLASLPDVGQLQAAAQQGANTINAAGTATAQQIQEAGASAASRIEQAAASSRNVMLGYLGFRSWKHAVILCFLPLLLAGGSTAAWVTEFTARKDLEEKLESWQKFGRWMQEKYPMVWEKYGK